MHEHIHTHRQGGHRPTYGESVRGRTTDIHTYIHVCLLTGLTPCHTHTTSNSTPELPVTLERILPPREHNLCQAPCRDAATHPVHWNIPWRAVFRPQNISRGHSQLCNRGLPRDDIPSHAWTIPAHIAISHLTHIHAARRTGLGRNTESDNILAASLPWDTQHMPPSLPRTHTQQPCRSQIPYPASSPPENP